MVILIHGIGVGIVSCRLTKFNIRVLCNDFFYHILIAVAGGKNDVTAFVCKLTEGFFFLTLRNVVLYKDLYAVTKLGLQRFFRLDKVLGIRGAFIADIDEPHFYRPICEMLLPQPVSYAGSQCNHTKSRDHCYQIASSSTHCLPPSPVPVGTRIQTLSFPRGSAPA